MVIVRTVVASSCYRASSTLPGFTTLPASSSVSRFYTDILFSPTPPIRGSLEEIVNHGISLMNKESAIINSKFHYSIALSNVKLLTTVAVIIILPKPVTIT